jgi:hypothetical protein
MEASTGHAGLEQLMQTQLLGIAEKARREKKHRFRNLFGQLNEEFLHTCWKDINMMRRNSRKHH